MKKKISRLCVLILIITTIAAGCGNEKNNSTESSASQKGESTVKTESELDEEIQEEQSEGMQVTEETEKDEEIQEEQSEEMQVTDESEKDEKIISTDQTESSKKQGNTVSGTGSNTTNNKPSANSSSDNKTESNSQNNTSSDSELEIVKNIIKKIIKNDMSDFEKVKAIHDYIVMNVDYDVVNYDKNTIPRTSRTVEGTLTTKYAVCEGYAVTVQAMCQAAGLECEYVVGEAKSKGKAESHAWNQVKVDGKWYNLDATWDDPSKRKGEAFDDHSYNSYGYFLLSDTDMYKDHKTENAKHICTAASIGNTAFEYGCPWLDIDGDNFIKTDDELKAAIVSALENRTSSFQLILRRADYTGEELSKKIKQITIEAGYNWSAINRGSGIGLASGYLMEWSLKLTENSEKFEMFTSEKDVKDFLIAWKNKQKEKWTVSSHGEQPYFYATTNQIDAASLQEWALLNGVQTIYYCGQEEIIDGYYYGQLTLRAYGYDVYDSLDGLGANIQAAYNRGDSQYTFLYDYRGTGMSENEAQSAIIRESMGADMINGESVLDESVEGLMLFCYYFK